MRSNGMLPYEYVADSSNTEVTGHVGLLPYIDLACVLGLLREVDARVGVCGEQGWMDRHHVLSLMLLNLAGGECVEDIRMLESDAGLCRVLREAELHGFGGGSRRRMAERFRRGRTRTLPSATRIYEYLDEFHNEPEEAKRVEGVAFVPAKNEHLEGLVGVNTALLRSVQRHAPHKEATLDIDATCNETTKREALFCYKGYRAYQPITTYWAETGMVVLSEFRDGNVPAGHDILRVLRESLAALPEGIDRVRVRMDSAGYQHDVLKSMATGDSGKRDVIEFSVSNDMTEEFRKAVMEVDEEDWKPLTRTERGREVPTGEEWAEVVYVPGAIAFTKDAPVYRYLAIRERVKQAVFPGMESIESQLDLPFATVTCAGRMYRVKGIVTNRQEDGAELIRWHYERCGKSEEAHAIMKTDLAGGTLPSGKFGANAAWWTIMTLAYNLHAAMRLLALPGPLKPKRMKAIRFALIDVPGRVVKHARQLFVRLSCSNPALDWLLEMRRLIRALALRPRQVQSAA
jgi:hypothetical protein